MSIRARSVPAPVFVRNRIAPESVLAHIFRFWLLSKSISARRLDAVSSSLIAGAVDDENAPVPAIVSFLVGVVVPIPT
jgi:hypothetical protein